MAVEALAASFALVALAELGDKTQLAIFSFSAKYRHRMPIIIGIALGFALVDGLAVVFGQAITTFISQDVLNIATSIAFIVFGIYFLLHTENEEEVQRKGKKSLFFSSFALITAMEMGDKTQLLTITLAAQYDAPLAVFAGSWGALMTLSLIALLVGRTIAQRVASHRIQYLSGALFILLGIAGLLRFA
ncbi:TMEM165/GDT1 family protein [archaeon]|nr:MAG: TMEM165/GDT1 family protein [archaeon]